MISEKYKCVFIHIPKAAGQSIENFFLNLHGLSWEQRAPLLLRFNPEPQKGPQRLAHLTMSEYLNYGYLDKHKFYNFFKFSFVRNPWARLVSEFNYREHHKKMSFKEFVIKGFPIKNNYSDVYRHIIPQYNFLYDDSGKCLVDFIGKFENLQKEFDVICSKLCIKDSKLPHINQSKQKSITKASAVTAPELKQLRKTQKYTEYYDDETKEIVERFYSKDIETFNYSFGS